MTCKDAPAWASLFALRGLTRPNGMPSSTVRHRFAVASEPQNRTQGDHGETLRNVWP
jgi:hypothetical protein